MEALLGTIQPLGFNFAPRGWAFCDGQLLPIAQNTALFSLLGTTFGGDGRTTFGLPDLRGRSIVHVGRGAGLTSVSWGEKTGREQVQLATTNLASHNHTGSLHATTGDATLDEPGTTVTLGTGQVVYSVDAKNKTLRPDTISINNTGSGTHFNIRNPLLGVRICIHIVGGTFPSRN